MRLSPGVRLGVFVVDVPLGAGGMGEVYRARDTTLARDVALKILPDAFALDPDRLARLRREAQVLASLNHPNIAAIYGFEDSHGASALVLEFVDGPTLADRIALGPLPLEEVIAIARQIAEALEAAHEQTVVHRDLKPSNVKLRPDGSVKVLDFGLAKALDTDLSSLSSRDRSESPTITSPALTKLGVVLGTAAYMSPEQARGRAADKRSDVWAFGCVLYEMLSGKRPFDGDETSDTLAAVLRADPDWSALPAHLPDPIVRLLHRCLEKDHKRRLRDIGDARLELDEAGSGSAMTVAPVSAAPSRRERWVWVGVVSVLTIALGAALVLGLRTKPSPQIQVDINTPTEADETSLALSPDGQRIAFVVTTRGQAQLWVRSLDSAGSHALAGTEGASYPFWSPDNRSIGFFSDNKVKRIDLSGGPARTLATTSPGRGGTWNRDGVILFATLDGPLRRVSAGGGQATDVTHVEAPQQKNHRFPRFLPDGQHFTFYVRGAPGVEGVYLGSLDGTPPRRLFEAEATTVEYASGHLFFIRRETVLAQPFDPSRLELSGTPVAVAEPVLVEVNALGAALSVSDSGTVAYRTATASNQRQLVWFGRTGAELRKVGSTDNKGLAHPELSLDGRHIVVERNVNGNQDLWLLEDSRGTLNPLTFDPAVDDYAVFSPDGQRIAFQSNRKGPVDIYVKSLIGDQAEDLLLTTPDFKNPADWSRDGKYVLFRQTGSETGYDLWALPMDGKTKPFAVVRTRAEERDGQISPDGKWLAYQSNESGRFEIYVQGFPQPQNRSRVSLNGGAQVRWRGDSKELFYIALDGQLMAVPMRLEPGPQTVDVGAPVALFRTRIAGGPVRGVSRQQYAVSPDGQRFLINTTTEEMPAAPITLILNWKPKP